MTESVHLHFGLPDVQLRPHPGLTFLVPGAAVPTDLLLPETLFIHPSPLLAEPDALEMDLESTCTLSKHIDIYMHK